MNRMMMFWMICLALTAGATAFVRGSRAAEPAGAELGPAPIAPVTTSSAVPQGPQAGATPQGPQAGATPQVPASRTAPAGVFSRVRIADLVATLVYALLGLALGLFGYKVYDWITPFDLRKELEIDQNTSIGIVCGAIILGMCIIVAAAIRG